MQMRFVPSSGISATLVGLVGWLWALSASAQLSDPSLGYIQGEFLTENGITAFGTTGGWGAVASGPCGIPTGTSVQCHGTGSPSSYQYAFSKNRTGAVSLYTPDPSDQFAVAIGGASAISTPPPFQTNVVQNVYTLANLSASAATSGITGSSASAVVGAWDTLTFGNVGSSSTATLIWNLNLAHTKNPNNGIAFAGDFGYGGACISFAAAGSNAFCDPTTATTNALQLNPGHVANPTLLGGQITISNVALNQPLLLYMSLYAVSPAGNFNVQNALIDPALTLDLPAGVTVTSASGLIGGLTPTVPLPASLPLLASGAAALLLMGVGRRRRVAV
jgi:hypothetical protein